MMTVSLMENSYLVLLMTRPSPIAIVALCIAALSILAFTINEEFGKKKRTTLGVGATKNANVVPPLVSYNPPHGQPGHRHDLPDGAPLPNSLPGAATTSSNTAAPSNNLLPTAAPAINAASSALNPEHGKPGHICGIPVGAPLDAASIANATKQTKPDPKPSTGLNPAHGQPGHRCDIAVGAPLNSTPAKATNTTNPTTAKTTTPTAANGLNPKHGEPGHRCDIAVGAPLNSAPTNKTNTAVKTPSLNPSLFPTYNFPNKDSGSAPAPAPTSTTPQFKYDSTGAALNPPHGQPGHDCYIKVGQPLKKK